MFQDFLKLGMFNLIITDATKEESLELAYMSYWLSMAYYHVKSYKSRIWSVNPRAMEHFVEVTAAAH